MEAQVRSSYSYQFGPYQVDIQAGQLRKHGTKIKLAGQPFEILVMLLERAGVVVTREEIQKRLWPDETFGDFENSLNKAINKLRQALADSAEQPTYIETLPRRGYRFLAPVTFPSSVHQGEVSTTLEALQSDVVIATWQQSRVIEQMPRRSTPLWAAMAFVLVLAAGISFYFYRAGQSRSSATQQPGGVVQPPQSGPGYLWPLWDSGIFPGRRRSRGFRRRCARCSTRSWRQDKDCGWFRASRFHKPS